MSKNKIVLSGIIQRANTLNQNSNSQYFDSAGAPISNILDKTGKESDSHNILSDIAGKKLSTSGETHSSQSGEDNNVISAVQSVLIKNNRFANVTTKSAFASKGTNLEDFESGESEGKISSQSSFGEFDLENTQVSLEQLKDVGLSLLYKASGYDSGEQPGSSINTGEVNAQIISEESQSRLISDSGYEKIEYKITRSKYAKGAPEGVGGTSTRDNRGEYFYDDPNASSSKAFGVDFNPTIHFSGRGRKILKIKSAIACLALKKITSDFINQITEFIKFKDMKDLQETSDDHVSLDKTYDGPGPYPLGSYKQLNYFQLDTLKKLVLVRTDYPYPACYEKGVEIFFGADDEVDKVKKYDHINQAPGYWLSISNSILKSFDQLSNSFSNLQNFESDSTDKIATLVDIVKSNKLIQFANAAATVGDIFFKSTGGLINKPKKSNRPYDVDSLPSGPGSRVGKSRDTGSESPLNLVWRQGSVPSMYLLPRNLIKASVDLNNIAAGASPARGMLTSVLVKNTYLDPDHGGSFNRIPSDVVKRLENKLEAEYVPFYIQDLRTNEVVSFHAFLTSLTDNIKADFNSVTGYGRMDPVQIYKSTSRTVGVTFVLYATSKEDFDSMWYKINKLTTLLYPQWTQGTQLSSDGTDRFIQPFSQVLGASPIVRLRVGDVIKSNYSRFNLARMFGIGDQKINAVSGNPDNDLAKKAKQFAGQKNEKGQMLADRMLKIFYGVMGTPLQAVPNSNKNRTDKLKTTVKRNFMSNFLINGFVNPLGAGLILRNLTDPNTRSISGPISTNVASLAEDAASFLLNTAADNGAGINLLGYHFPQRVFVKANMNRGYRCSDGTVVRFDRPLRAMVQLKGKLPPEANDNAGNSFVSSENFKKNETYDNIRERTRYELLIIDPAGPMNVIFKTIEVDHQDIMPDPKDLFMTTSGLLLGIAQPLAFLDYIAEYVSDAAFALGRYSRQTLAGLVGAPWR